MLHDSLPSPKLMGKNFMPESHAFCRSIYSNKLQSFAISGAFGKNADDGTNEEENEKDYRD